MVYLLKSGLHIFPHIFVWGSCFWFCIPPQPPPPPHNFVTHNFVTHTPFFNTNFHTHNFVTHHLSTQTTRVLRGRCGTSGTGLDLVARLVPVGRPWRRGTLRGRRSTWRHPPSFCLAGVAVGDIYLRFPGRRGTALGDIHRHFAWQASTWSHRPSFSVAGVALRDIHAASESISLKYDFVTHTQLCHTHTQLRHTQSFTHNFVIHNFVTHTILSYTTLSHTHTTLSHTIFHTQLCHTQSFTHNFVTHNISHTIVSPHNLSHTTLSYTIFHTQLCHTHNISHTIVSPHNLSHTTLSHTQLCHIQLFHTELFRYNFQNCRSSTISFVLVAFSAPLQPLFLLGGRSWHVGLSGPFIFEWPGMAYQLSLLMIRGKVIAANHRSMGVKMGPWA